ncbi:aquaporin-9 [Pogona vitticeps]|uniref:Aquaporin-9 n=1 Tax=Pogona vitticeps TaxID=103695 RepID=A0A6J0SVS7_9SAUR|nr:aquaporin-9 [Pogona vitticeps]
MTKKAGRRLRDRFALKNHLVKEALAEFLGTFILIALGCGCVAQSVLSRGAFGGAPVISIGFSMAVTIGIYVAGGVSGGHINPAVTFALCLAGKVKWIKFPIYTIAQCLGAFVGAAVVFGINYDALMDYTGGEFNVTGPKATALIFATYPAEYLTPINGFADQVMSTAILLLGIFAIFDEGNLRVPKGLEPIAVGLLILLLTSSLAMNAGCAMNPARDIAPRIFSYMAGWGPEVFTAGNNWWWVPIVAPMLGGALGAVLYMLFIELHHPPQNEGAKHGQHELTNMEEEKWFQKEQMAL